MVKSTIRPFIYVILCSLTLNGCNYYTGDFGRPNVNRLSHLTNQHEKVINKETGEKYLNPIAYSLVEQKFRLASYPLLNIDLDIRLPKEVIDQYLKMSSSFEDINIYLADFIKYAGLANAKNNSRYQLEPQYLTKNIQKAITDREAENHALIQKTATHLNKLFQYYGHKITKAHILDPSINPNKVTALYEEFGQLLSRLNMQI